MWISVKQCLPYVGNQVLAYGRLAGEETRTVNEAFVEYEGRNWQSVRGPEGMLLKLDDVTHWMPMPLGPGE